MCSFSDALLRHAWMVDGLLYGLCFATLGVGVAAAWDMWKERGRG